MGQGGMILTDKKTLSSFIESLKTFNRSGDKSDFHKGFGLNFKITDLQAAMGNSQFKKLGKHIEAKKKILDNMIEKHGDGDYVKTMSNAIHKMLDPEYRNREASFRCATANSMSGYEKYKVEPITNKITEI